MAQDDVYVSLINIISLINYHIHVLIGRGLIIRPFRNLNDTFINMPLTSVAPFTNMV